MKPVRAWRILFFWWITAMFAAAPVWAEEGAGTRKWEMLSPQEQERVLKNYEAWKRLPSGEQHRVRESFDQFRKMPLEEQDRVRQNYRRFQKLSPERQIQLRRRFEHFKQLSPEERTRLRERIEARREQQGKDPRPEREHPRRKESAPHARPKGPG
jgi:hypothetical protein